jgi:hypothetical protein
MPNLVNPAVVESRDKAHWKGARLWRPTKEHSERIPEPGPEIPELQPKIDVNIIHLFHN